MEPPDRVDLTNCSFDEFVSFLFDRDTPSESRKKDPWYYHLEVTFDSRTICAYYTRLFREPAFLLTRFTKPQIEEGFWAIQGPNLDCSVYGIIHRSDLPISMLGECIRSMADLFERLFANESLDSSVQMWWDSLCYDWHCGNRNREHGGMDLELQEAFFQALSRLLAMNSEVCQGAALHGLSHLHHPGTNELVERFIKERPSLTKEWKAYALAAAKFDLM
jgi:hypothetical protein